MAEGEIYKNPILNDVKRICNIYPESTEFDEILLMYIRATRTTLEQLGVLDEDAGGIPIGPNTKWEVLTNGEILFDDLQTYVGMKVRMMFDPPANGSVSEAIKSTISELEFRMMITTNHLRRKEASDE